jgi:hypothetical protein
MFYLQYYPSSHYPKYFLKISNENCTENNHTPEGGLQDRPYYMYLYYTFKTTTLWIQRHLLSTCYILCLTQNYFAELIHQHSSLWFLGEETEAQQENRKAGFLKFQFVRVIWKINLNSGCWAGSQKFLIQSVWGRPWEFAFLTCS